jgi:ATP-binding cassette, subfamily B, multidrug efflux pump
MFRRERVSNPSKAKPDAAHRELLSGPEVERLYQPKVDSVVLRRLLAYARPYRARIALAVLLLLLLSGGELLFPILTKRAIDVCIKGHDLHGLAQLSLLYLGLLLAVFGLRYFQSFLTGATGQRIVTDLRGSIFAHVQTLDLRYFERNPVGRVMTRLTSDVETLNDLFTSGLVSIFGDVLTLFGITAVMLWLNWKLALITLTVVPLLLTVTLIFRAKVRVAYALIRVRIAAINAFLQENLTGISLVQLFSREDIHRDKFAHLNAAHRDSFLKSVFYYSVYFPLVEFLEALALALILWYGGGEAIQGALTLGALVAFIQYSERFFRPIRDLSDRYNILQGAMASSERIFELLDTRPLIESPDPSAPATAESTASAFPSAGWDQTRPGLPRESAAPPAATAATAVVEFREVHFAYVTGQNVLKGISFAVHQGESVALVGHTGAGKTTIASLLSRFYDVDQGAILVNGVDVRRWNLADLRRRVGLVPQEVFLWSGGIRLNVALRGGRPDERVDRAVRLVGADTFAGRGQDLAGGGRTEVGERGSQLSAGQRQLISFARALAADPPILVLDEATSSVDTETEQRIREALRVLLQGRTSLVIAHRLSTIRYVDRVLVLHRGVLAEEGTHDELLRRGGIYARYYELEYRGQEIVTLPTG